LHFRFVLQQRIVIKVQMSGDKSRSKALGLVAKTHGKQALHNRMQWQR
jgi:hypothetical protein